MHGKKPLAHPMDCIYLYDGSFEGFLCCVYHSVYHRELPCDICIEGNAQPTLFEQTFILTEPEKAARVLNSISKKISTAALELVESVFLSCLAQKEIALLSFLLLGYTEGAKIMNMLAHPDVTPILNAQKHLAGEAHLLKGFIRFSDYGGVFAASIAAKNFILPFIADHFVARFSGENFIIYDKIHKAALLYQNRERRIVPLENIHFPEADETELAYRAMWTQFYNTIAIEARYNPKCRMTHMPKRYWENMTEMQGQQ